MTEILIRCAIVAVPTSSDKTKIVKVNNCFTLNHDFSYTNSTYYDLYILSEDNLNENDWVLYNNKPYLIYKDETSTFLVIKTDVAILYVKNELFVNKFKKIIATTNKELKDKFPTIRKSLIKEFCETNGAISNVLVKYENYFIDTKNNQEIKYWGFETDMLIEDGVIVPEKRQRPYVNYKNQLEIVTNKTYTREEVIDLFKKYQKELSQQLSSNSENITPIKWAEENI